MSATKVCSRCQTEKDISHYYPKRGRCKQCLLELNNEYRNKPEIKEAQLARDRDRWRRIKQEKNARRNAINKTKANSPEEMQRRENRKLQRKLEAAQRRIEKLEERIARKRELRRIYNNKLRSTNKGKIDHVMSNAIRSHLLFEGVSKEKRQWEKLVGYSVADLIAHLEKQFKPEMNWDNYGTYWHIDHVKPKSWFAFQSAEDQSFRECWALSNLQPLEAKLNISKGNRYEG
jgi:hypothetical protein